MSILLLFFHLVNAQVGTTADAMGGAGVAGVQPLESSILNPAALIEIKQSYAGAQSFSGDVLSNVNESQYTFYMMDGGEQTLVPGSLFYRRRIFDSGGQRVREDQWQFSLATALSKEISVGFTGYKIKTDLPFGQDYNQYNSDIGMYYRPNTKWSFGAIMRGVFGSKNTVWLPSRVLPSTALGTEYRLYEMFRFRYDINYFLEQNGDKRFLHQIGGEVHYDFDLVLRTGFSNDDRKHENRWTAGIGWDGPRLKVAYAYQKEMRQKLGDFHTFDIWFDF